MKNFNYKIQKNLALWGVSFYECRYQRINNNKLDICMLLGLPINEWDKLLCEHNYLSYSDAGFYRYEAFFGNSADAQRFAETIESYIVLNTLVEG